jgi:prepilin-type N-terminal cleavage/methylation domain-containing protein
MSIAHGASIMRTQGRIRGFTLLEVMVAMLLAVIIMVTVHFALYGVLYARDSIDEELAGVEVGPTILDLIERDLMALHVYNVEGNRILHGVSQSLGGHDADQIDFLADVNSSVTRSKLYDENDKTRSPVTEVGYRVRTNPDNQDFLELWRRQDFFVDNLPFEGGAYERVYSQIRRFHVGYYEKLDEDKEEVREWDVADKGMLPAAIVITLELEVEPRRDGVSYSLEEQRRRTYTYSRTIMPPRDADVAMRLKPLIPDVQHMMTTSDGDSSGSDSGLGAGGSLAEGGGMASDGSMGQRKRIEMGPGGPGMGLGKSGSVADHFKLGGKGGGPGTFKGGSGKGDLSQDEKDFLDKFFKEWMKKK